MSWRSKVLSLSWHFHPSSFNYVPVSSLIRVSMESYIRERYSDPTLQLSKICDKYKKRCLLQHLFGVIIVIPANKISSLIYFFRKRGSKIHVSSLQVNPDPILICFLRVSIESYRMERHSDPMLQLFKICDKYKKKAST